MNLRTFRNNNAAITFRTLMLVGFIVATQSMVEPLPAEEQPHYSSELVFPLHDRHNHAPGIVEYANGDLLVSWYRGSGERTADDVAVWGAKKTVGSNQWSKPFLLVDTPGFPDCNTCMLIDDRQRLWLFWPVVVANSWESCITHYLVSSDYVEHHEPRWTDRGVILLKPNDFQDQALARWAEVSQGMTFTPEQKREIDEFKTRLGDKLYQRLGWQPRCKPTILPSGRMLLPLYSDTYSFSIMAISDDQGKSWFASDLLMGFGNIQPAVLRRANGTLVAYMRENGPRERIRACESKDDGQTWGPVFDSPLPNPGSGLDAVQLHDGSWFLVYNDTVDGRNSLAISLSTDEGKSWPWTRHLEQQQSGAYHYPAVIAGRDNQLHVVYSYFVAAGKSMKYVSTNAAWVRHGQ